MLYRPNSSFAASPDLEFDDAKKFETTEERSFVLFALHYYSISSFLIVVYDKYIEIKEIIK